MPPKEHSTTSGASARAETTSQTESQSTSTPRPHILVLGFMNEDFLDDLFEHLMSSIRDVATLTKVSIASRARYFLSSEPPSAVLVIDGAPAQPEFRHILPPLIAYAKSGGTVVLGCNFSNHFPPSQARQFFETWGAPWDAGSYHRTTVHLNSQATIPGMSLEGLEPSYSVKALNLKNAGPNAALYSPSSESRVQSHVFAPTPVDVTESPAVYMRVGKGYLGYTGDVNAEEPTTKVIMAMLHLPVRQVKKDTRDHVVGYTLGPGGFVPIKQSERDAEEARSGGSPPRVVHTEARYIPEEGLIAGVAYAPVTNAGPSRIPRRPRESEVEKRRKKRTKHAERLKIKADQFKEEGNQRFREGKWGEAAILYKTAARTYKPLPVYMTNLAACLLRLERWEEAKRVATHAVMGDPTSVKAHYRRGLARRKLGNIAGATRDLKRVLDIQAENKEADQELKDLLANETIEDNADSGEEDTDDEGIISAYRVPGSVNHILECPSDSEDYSHEGNGKPCLFYNHGGCKHGKRCRFKHAADTRSIRDELGRNVCLHWLVQRCNFSAEKCWYAHDTTYLPKGGWWTQVLSGIAYQNLYDLEKAKGVGDVLDTWLGGEMNGKTMPWENLKTERGDARVHLTAYSIGHELEAAIKEELGNESDTWYEYNYN